MRLDDFEYVAQLIECRLKILKAMNQCQASIDDAVDSSHDEELLQGFYGYISKHDDGSGPQVNLVGCYVLDDMLSATYTVLENKLTKVDAELNRLGVEVD